MERLLRSVFVLVLLATPFSTGRDSAAGGVIPFALPPLAVFAGLYLAALSFRRRVVLPSRSRTLVAVAVTYAIFVNAMALFSADVVASLFRASVNVLAVPLLLFAAGADLRDEARREARGRLVRRWLVVSGVVLAAYFLGNVAVQIGRYGAPVVFAERQVGGLMELPWGATNVVASVLLLPTFVAGLERGQAQGRVRLLMGAAIVVMVAAIALTFSRTVLGALLAGFIVFNVGHNGFRGMLKVLAVPALVALVLGLAGLYFFGGDVMGDVFRSRTNDSNLRRVGGRSEVWEATLAHIRQNPATPIGYYSSIYDVGFSGHNLILTTYVEMGAIGVVLTLGLFGSVLRVLARSMKNPAYHRAAFLLIGMWAAYFVNTQFEDVLYAFPSLVNLWTCLGLCIGVERSARGIPTSITHPRAAAPALAT